MSEVLIDGFKFSKWAGGKLLLVIESDRLRECIEYCNDRCIEWVHISPYHGYRLNNLDCLRECPRVIGVHMQRGFDDYRGLYELPVLSWLSAIFPHEIDLSAIPLLSDLSTDWNPKIDSAIFAAKQLRRLWLRGYKSPTKDLTCVRTLNKLEELCIVLSQIQSIHGIEKLAKLKTLRLSYCKDLADIDSLAMRAETLEELEVDHCKRIKDLTKIQVLLRLRKAILMDSGKISSLSFVTRMPQLEFLSFVGMNVVDGDMTPCFKLKYAGFLKKRHYSHTPEEVKQVICANTKEKKA